MKLHAQRRISIDANDIWTLFGFIRAESFTSYYTKINEQLNNVAEYWNEFTKHTFNITNNEKKYCLLLFIATVLNKSLQYVHYHDSSP